MPAERRWIRLRLWERLGADDMGILRGAQGDEALMECQNWVDNDKFDRNVLGCILRFGRERGECGQNSGVFE
jgi:hypothetical protein